MSEESSVDANPGCYRLFVFTSSEDRKFEIMGMVGIRG